MAQCGLTMAAQDPVLQNTPEWVVTHARAQQRLLRWGERVYHGLPQAMHPRAAAWLGQRFSPETPSAVKIWSGLQQLTQCSDAQAHGLLAQWYANQGAFAIDLHNYAGLDKRWAHETVHMKPDERQLMLDVVASGGLVLNCHSHHHNRFGSLLGLSGATLWPVAGPEKGSLWEPWTGRFMRLINGGSEAYFRGGRYLFTDDMRQLLLNARAALQRKELLGTSADGPQVSPSVVPVNLAGRRLDMATALVDMTVNAGLPVACGMLYSDLRGGHRCRFACAAPTATVAEIAQHYASSIVQWCRDDPFAWQGWVWWDDLPFATPPDAATEQARASAAARFAASRPSKGWAAKALEALVAIEGRLSPPRP